jgi:hypothetical protein
METKTQAYVGTFSTKKSRTLQLGRKLEQTAGVLVWLISLIGLLGLGALFATPYASLWLQRIIWGILGG